MAEDDADLRAAWRARLQREGKLIPRRGSLADLVLGPAEPRLTRSGPSARLAPGSASRRASAAGGVDRPAASAS